MKQGEIQQMLVATNRWWRQPVDWARDDPDLREANDAPFHYSAGVLDGLAPGGLYVLRGPRRVGKSVEIKRAVERLIAGGAEKHSACLGGRLARRGFGQVGQCGPAVDAQQGATALVHRRGGWHHGRLAGADQVAAGQ